jgi:hypothetical protein
MRSNTCPQVEVNTCFNGQATLLLHYLRVSFKITAKLKKTIAA